MTKEELLQLPKGIYRAYLGIYDTYGIIDVKETATGDKLYYFYSNNSFLGGNCDHIKNCKYSWFLYRSGSYWNISERDILSLNITNTTIGEL